LIRWPPWTFYILISNFPVEIDLVIFQFKNIKSGKTTTSEGIKLYSNEPWLFEKRGSIKEELGDKLGALCDYAQSCKLDPHYLHIGYHVYRFFGSYRSDKSP
jgi:hypothetical protein